MHWHADAATGSTSYSPLQVAAAYGFPDGTGAGECVAIIELGGGERMADLSTYFSGLGVSPGPKVVAVSVDHGKNHPTGNPNGPGHDFPSNGCTVGGDSFVSPTAVT